MFFFFLPPYQEQNMHLKYVYSLHIDITEMATKSDFFFHSVNIY